MKRGTLGVLIRESSQGKTYCNGASHVWINLRGEWQVVDKYLKIDHSKCVPLIHQKRFDETDFTDTQPITPYKTK